LVTAGNSVPISAIPAEKADAMSELSFPASDPPSVTPEGGVHLDASALHQPVPASPAVRRFLIQGLQAAYRSEASARDWLPALSAAVTTPSLRQCLDQLLAEVCSHLEKLQHALACFGVSHDTASTPLSPAIGAALAMHQPTAALFDLAASVVVRADRAAALSTYALLQGAAGAAGLTGPVPFLQDCVAGTRRSTDELTRLCVDELVPAAVRAGDDPLPDAFMRLVFGTTPTVPALAPQ
jgi:ferritin-like metal-binding protein YciE